jgi:hypothetical protein
MITPPTPAPTKNAKSIKRITAGIVNVSITIVYYKYDKGLRYPARGAIGIVMFVPQTLLL